MSVETFREYVASIAPDGGVLSTCDADGTLQRRPGTFAVAVGTPQVAASHLAGAFWVRFPADRNIDVLTTDPWSYLADEDAWVLPVLDLTDAPPSWLRLDPSGATP